MAVENFLHDADGVSSLTTKMSEELTNYKNNISSLEQLINTINSSSAWKDENVKTSYINTVTSYLQAYKDFSNGIEGYINSLNKKSANISEHENNYS